MDFEIGCLEDAREGQDLIFEFLSTKVFIASDKRYGIEIVC